MSLCRLGSSFDEASSVLFESSDFELARDSSIRERAKGIDSCVALTSVGVGLAVVPSISLTSSNLVGKLSLVIAVVALAAGAAGSVGPRWIFRWRV